MVSRFAKSHSRSRRQSTRAVFGVTLGALLLFGSAKVSHADNIDDELIKRAPALVKTLQGKGYKTVGVLKFLVQAGKASPNANVGPLNLIMSTRLENALIFGMDPAHPIRVTRDATHAAAKSNPRFTTLTTSGREDLFKHSYPLAWGTEKATPDVFLTGLVSLTPNMREATVTIESFDKTGGQPHTVMKFEVQTDRSILADSGRSFVLKGRSAKMRSIDELDDAAADSAAAADNGQPITQQASGEMPIKFEIRYNDVPQVISQDPGSIGEMRVNTPQEGDSVVFVVTNTTQSKIGVLVKVNGESTLGQDTSEDDECMKWILEAGKSYSLRGFYTYPENKITVFKVLNDDDSAARMSEWSGSRPRAGYIDISVFTPGSETNSSDMVVAVPSLRGVGKGHGKSPHPKSAAEASRLVHARLAKPVGKRKPSRRGLVVAGDSTEDANLKEDHLDNLTSTFQMQINYYKPGSP